MDNSRTKIVVILFVLGFVAIVSALIPMLINSGYAKDRQAIGAWISPTPSSPPTKANTASSTPVPSPTRNNTATPNSDPVIEQTPVVCVHSVIYWADHTELWPSVVRIGSFTYTRDSSLALFNKPSSDLNTDLFILLHAAFLNLTNGAQNSAIEKTVVAAADWLFSHSNGTPINDTDKQEATKFTSDLANYNNGRLGPALCSNETLFSPATVVPSSTFTLTPTQTIFFVTRAATHTPTTTSMPNPPPQNIPTRTQTLIPTNAPTATQIVLPTLVPTVPSTPVPTIIPTAVPTPVPTEVPPTAVPTSIG